MNYSMLDPLLIIEELNRISKSYFLENTFYFNPLAIHRYYSTGNNTSKAINHNKNSNEEINVVKWFDDFWVYVEILFSQTSQNKIDIFFSFSVFEGEAEDNIKNQLFRAEWDNYDDNSIHPQPHWHFHSNDISEEVVMNFADMIEEEQSDFLDMINDEKAKVININKMHFAMSAMWNNNINGHINKIKEENELIYWYEGLLSHIRTQLEFVKY